MAPPLTGSDRLIRVGGLVWVLTIGYFAMQVWVAAAWEPPYDVADDTISSLGVTDCDDDACSPRHVAMNATFVVVGVVTAAGALLTRRAWPATGSNGRLATWGAAGLVLAGLGGVLIGLAPSNSYPVHHAIGVAPQVLGALAPLLIGLAILRTRPRLGWYSIVLGGIGSVAIVLFLAGWYPGLGQGTMERLGIESHLVWTTTVGALLLARGADPYPVS